jgi:hypothetical protein
MMGIPHKKRGAKLVLQLRYCAAQRRLRNITPLGCSGEIQFLTQNEEITKLP